MPTGYTADIEKGISFPQFAMSCARAFGALVEMREEPYDAVIPEEFQPSDYHINALKNAEQELNDIGCCSIDFATKNSQKEYDKEVEDNKRYRNNKRLLKEKYIKMLKEVNDWNPPSEEHEGLKKFMIDQIKGSIDFDCSEYPQQKPILLTGKQWIDKQKKQILKDIEYHSKEYKEECDRVAGRNKWIKQLRESLQ
jgi:hypothetical protein